MKKLFPIISVLCLMWSGNVFALTLECTEKRQTIPLDGNNVQYLDYSTPKIIIILDNNGDVHVTSYKLKDKKIVKDTEKFFLIEKKAGGKIQTNRVAWDPLDEFSIEEYYKIDTDTMEVLMFWGLKPEVAKILNEDRPEDVIINNKKIRLEKVKDRLILYFTNCKNISSNNEGSGSGSSGTAFFINSKGYLLTNNHVVEGCKLQKIKYKGKDYDANILATDKTLDLALMKIEAKPKNYLNFSESSPEKLQKVYVAGYPFGKGLSDDLKISSGIVSSVKGFDDNSNEFQVDAPINPGNSGGPIVDDTGELIGIAVAGFAKDKSEGINFGIKSLSAVTFLKTNKIDPETSYMTFGMNNKKLLQLLEETTVYTYCN
jgi:S1-C subfamily serine protease